MVYSRAQYWGQYYSTLSLKVWMRGWNAPSANLQITQNQEEWLITPYDCAAIQRGLDRPESWIQKKVQ